ncbi:mobilization protein [Streptomyces sp. NBC_00347]|uniref:relaxase/mobilization nuclease domain-containing protein n=1 Tax=Streptomyces sp. NBC_00347 TaxID=2975721 RepID=UPI002254A0D4|nr:mobilization protein [Streptomyces sp. NBC_00347]MCX5123719.1 mobilization protein [Streptomyces sp. NBC_00347]
MIPSIHKQGGDTAGLIAYLFGAGRSEEHIDPHLVASFDGLAPDPGRDPGATEADLQQLLDEPLHLLPAGTRPDKHVWHASVRAAPGDRTLTDTEWADIARRVIAATGIDPGDGAGCRWAAVRHADDHIHLIATLVREDARKPDHHRSGKRAQAECRRIEVDYDLYRVAPGDGTAAKRPTSAEQHKAKRRGRDRTAREELRETVRRAAAGTASETEFLDRLATAGLLIKLRTAPSGDTLGYTVALPEDRNKDGAPIHYAGSKLAPDLSLPRLRERWTGAPTQATAPQAGSPAASRRRATGAVWQAVLLVDQGDDTTVAALIAAGGEVLDALAKTSAAHTRHQLRDAAAAFERAARSHIRAERGQDQALRQAARELVHGGPALGRGEDAATGAMLIDMVFFLATAASAWHAKKGHAQQAVAALQAAQHIRAAYQTAAAHPMAVLQEHGRHMPRPLELHLASMLRDAIPNLAEQVLAEPGWPALAATLADVQVAGHEPAELLTEAIGSRELGSATSVSDVLVWRLRHLAQLPADPGTARPQTAHTRSATTPPITTKTATKVIGDGAHRR